MGDEDTPGLGFYFGVVTACLIVCVAALAGLHYIGLINLPLYSSGERSRATVPKRENPELSEKNYAAARAALDAIGEVNSVASVGPNYLQYTSSLQQAKIKFDAAMRSFNSGTEEDAAIRTGLIESLQVYTDAKIAWDEFVRYGGEFDAGYLIPRTGVMAVDNMDAVYHFGRSSLGYNQEKVLSTIFIMGDRKFRAVDDRIRRAAIAARPE